MAQVADHGKSSPRVIDCAISRAKVLKCFHDGQHVVAEIRCDKCASTDRINVKPHWNVPSVASRFRAHRWDVETEGRKALCPACKAPKRGSAEVPVGRPVTPRPAVVPPSPAVAPPSPAVAPPSPATTSPAVVVTPNAAKQRPDLPPRQCESPGCTVIYKPDRISQRFHDLQCARKAHRFERKQREKDPSVSTPHAMPTTSPEAIRAERLMYQLIDDHYHETTHRYDEGWSDERVAKESGIAIARVKLCREALYGKPVSAEMLKLRDDVAAARASTVKSRETLEAMVRDASVDLRSLISAEFEKQNEILRELANRIAREIGSDS